MGWLLALVGIVSAGALLLARSGASDLPLDSDALWRQRAEVLGLRLGAVGLGNEPLLLHEADGLQLTLRPESPLSWGPEDAVRVEVRLPRGSSAGLEFGPHVLDTEGGVPTGDAEFDAAVLVFGDEPVVNGALDQATRAALAPLVGEGLRWSDDRVSLTMRPPELEPAALRSQVSALRALVVRVRDRLADLPASLAETARSDIAPVRLRCARHLGERWPQDFATQLPWLLRDDSPELRLFAAQRAGRDGAHVLAELARDASVRSPLRRRALNSVSERYPELIEGVAAPLLGDNALDVDAAMALATAGLHDHAPSLAARLLTHASTERIEAFARFQHACVEVTLLPLLNQERLRDAVVTALGLRGGRNSVEPLLSLAAERSTPRELRAAAQAAVARIQSSLGGAEAGRLAVLPEQALAGALALAGEVGSLALAQGGELSAPSPADSSAARVVAGRDEG